MKHKERNINALPDYTAKELNLRHKKLLLARLEGFEDALRLGAIVNGKALPGLAYATSMDEEDRGLAAIVFVTDAPLQAYEQAGTPDEGYKYLPATWLDGHNEVGLGRLVYDAMRRTTLIHTHATSNAGGQLFLDAQDLSWLYRERNATLELKFPL